MTHFRRCWDDEKRRFLLDHKDMSRKELYALFCRTFGRTDISFCAVMNERSRCGAVRKKNPHKSTKAKPLYSEQVKKGFVRIKVAQPNVWIQKSRWVYEETHPGYIYDSSDCFYFLDGDQRNFSPDNIALMKRPCQGLFQFFGGTVKGHPELTRLHILQARMRLAQLDIAEKAGLTLKSGAGRRFKREAAAAARKAWHRKTDEERRAVLHERWLKLKERMAADPEFREEYRARMRSYQNRLNAEKRKLKGK